MTIESYECDDGTVDIELQLVDQKSFGFIDRERGPRDPGDPVHSINVRVSIDRNLEVLNIETDLDDMPFAYCQDAAANVPNLHGKRLDRGWRRSVREVLGATRGCTHLAELLGLAPTVAFQTQAIQRSKSGSAIGKDDATHQEPPFFIGGCYSWAADSPVTTTYFPQFGTVDRKDE